LLIRVDGEDMCAWRRVVRRLEGSVGISNSEAGDGGRFRGGCEAGMESCDEDASESSAPELWSSSASESRTCAAVRLCAAPDARRAGAFAALAPDTLRLAVVGVDVLAAPVLVRGRWGLKGLVFGAVREGGMVGCVRVCCLKDEAVVTRLMGAAVSLGNQEVVYWLRKRSIVLSMRLRALQFLILLSYLPLECVGRVVVTDYSTQSTPTTIRTTRRAAPLRHEVTCISAVYTPKGRYTALILSIQCTHI
jgi:hypothetical protein